MLLKLLPFESTLCCYPDDALAEQIEQELAASLAPIPCLSRQMTSEQRLSVFELETAKSRAEFCRMHGDPFGLDASSAPCPALIQTQALPLKLAVNR